MKSNSETILIHYNIKDIYRAYGVNHFFQKYGLQYNGKESKISLAYGNSKNIDGFNIKILENNLEKEISGYLNIGNDEKNIPLFEKAERLNEKGQILVLFLDGNRKYPCVVLEENTITIGFDIFNEVGHILSGYLEQFWGKVNNNYQELTKIPVLDYYENILFNCLVIASNKLNVSLRCKQFWPNGKKFAVCLTHDVDSVQKTYQYLTHFLKHLKRGNFSDAINQFESLLEKLHGNEPWWNFDKIIQMEKRLGAKSTFFFLDEKGKTSLFNLRSRVIFSGRYKLSNRKIVDIIKKIKDEGWEIGTHGSYYSYNNKLLLEKEKQVLENILEMPVQGIRQHYLNLEIPYTWKLHDENGFKYDTTLGFRKEIGFRYGTCFPFHPFDVDSEKQYFLLEIPLIIMDIALFSKKNEWDACKEIAEIVEKFGGVLTLNWHQEVFELKNWTEIYERLIIFCKERGAWITSANEIDQWMKSKNELS